MPCSSCSSSSSDDGHHHHQQHYHGGYDNHHSHYKQQHWQPSYGGGHHQRNIWYDNGNVWTPHYGGGCGGNHCGVRQPWWWTQTPNIGHPHGFAPNAYGYLPLPPPQPQYGGWY